MIELTLPEAEVRRIAAEVVRQLRANPEQELLTPAQASKRTGLTLKALERRRSRNQPPLSVRRGGRVFYPAVEIARFVGESAT